MPPDIVSKVQDLAIKAYQITDCAGMARVDFLVDRQNGDLFLNEINTIPGFTKISMYPKLWEATGLPYKALIEKLIQLAMERKAQRDQTEREFRS
jgi:D-alanine-D-alanine ligase